MTTCPSKTTVIGLLEKTKADSTCWQIQDVLAAPKQPTLISFLNAHGINTAIRDQDFRDILLNSDFLLRDGVGIELALKWFGLGPTANLNGTDLIPELLKSIPKNRSIAIFGTRTEVLNQCRDRLQSDGHDNIVALMDGFQGTQAYIDIYKKTAPALTILCMGMPRQEHVAKALLTANIPGLIICAGGWADFHAGIKSRAPQWVQNMRAEWLYRFANEPIRLGKRYTIDLLIFFWNIGRAKMNKRAP